MIGSVGGGNSILALFQARTTTARSVTGTPKSDKETEAAKVADEKRQKSEELLRTLRQMNTDKKREHKAAAAQKVERLKKELENLRMFSGGDPKAIARQAARIARELGAAAKEYSSAGGGVAVGGSAPSVSTGEAMTSGEAMMSGEAGAEAGISADGGAGEGVAAAAAEAEQVAADAKAKASGTEQDAHAEGKIAEPLTPEEERVAFVDKLNAMVGESQSRASESEADTKFANDVRNLFNQAKALVEQQRRRAAAENHDDSEFEQFAKEVRAAGEAIHQAFSGVGMESGIVTAQSPVNITV